MDLVIMKDQQAVTSSLQMADTFQKDHRVVLKAIDDLKEGLAQKYADLFWEAISMDRAEALKVGKIIADRWLEYQAPIIKMRQHIERMQKKATQAGKQ